jgi:AAA domain-containing protein
MSQSTQDKQIEKGLLAIFKGDSGEGKSVAGLSFPNTYVFDFDQKMPSIAQKHFPDKIIRWDTFEDIFEIDKMVQEFSAQCPYETLLIDSITGLVNIVMNSVGQVKQESVPDILKRTSKSGSIEMMGIDYYSAEDRFCTYFVDKMKLLWARPGNPKHVIFTAHVVTVESSPDLKTKLVTRTRSIVSKGKKFAAWMPTGFDNVYIFGRQLPDMGDINQTVKRIVKTESFGEDSGKCSFNFPETIEFTNSSLYDKLVSYGLPK